jgi:hypothetical protein
VVDKDTILLAIAQALDDVGLAPGGDDESAAAFLEALKEGGYIVVPDPSQTEGGEE